MRERERDTVIYKQPHLSSCVVHYFLSRQVTLVAHQKFIDIFTGISVNFLKPLLDIVIGLLYNENVNMNKKPSLYMNTKYLQKSGHDSVQIFCGEHSKTRLSFFTKLTRLQIKVASIGKYLFILLQIK